MKDGVSHSSETVRTAVRAKTDEAHARLHLHSSFVDLFDGRLSVEKYRDLVARFHGFYAPLDQAIEDVLASMKPPAPPYAYVRRSGILAQDLADLNLDDRAIGQSPRCLKAYDIVTPTTLGGVLYVIEGATLGATQIDRAAQKLLSSDAPDGRRFWQWCRAQNKHRWAMANAYMEHRHDQGVALEDIAQGAQDTFEVLAEWLAPLDQQQPATGRTLG